METTTKGNLEQVNEVSDALRSIAGLSSENAKTATYWALGTHAQHKLDLFPILVIQGEFGTGKSTLMRNLRNLAGFSELDVINVKESSAAFIRSVIQTEETAFLDESDGLDESLLIGRYNRFDGVSGKMANSGFDGWKTSPRVMYGATAVSRRLPFREYQIRSRAILIYTERRTDGRFDALTREKLGELYFNLADISEGIDWKSVDSNLVRTRNNWAPLIAVAEYVGDAEWLETALKRIEIDLDISGSGTEYEPKKLVFAYLLAEALDGGEQPKEIVRQKNLRTAIQKDEYDFNQVQIGQLVREMGFATETRGGMATIITGGAENLRRIGLKLGIDDTWINQSS